MTRTVKVPQGAVGEVITFPAPGRKPRKHVSAGKYDKALAWFLRVRYLQNQENYTFKKALDQANREFEPAPPGRARQKGSLR